MTNEGTFDDVRPVLHGRGPDLISDFVDFIADCVEVGIRKGIRGSLADLGKACEQRPQAQDTWARLRSEGLRV